MADETEVCEDDVTKKMFRRCVGVAVTAVHVAIVLSITYALFAIKTLDQAFKLFVVLAAILLSFVYFQTCVLHALEEFYNPGYSYMHLVKRYVLIELDTLEKTASLQVILLGMSLLVVKVCYLLIQSS